MQAVHDETKKVSQRVEQSQKTLVGHAGLLENISRSIKGLVSRQKENQLLSNTYKILQWNAKTFSAVTQMQQVLSSIPPQIQLEQPIVFEDAHGRITPFHVEFINSYAAFQAVLEARFKNLPGHRKVKRLEYAVQDTRSKGILDLSRPWETNMRPGRKFVMSMVFQGTKGVNSSCPGCFTEAANHLKSEGSDIQWYEEVISHPFLPNEYISNELIAPSTTVIILIAVLSFVA